MRFGLDKEEKIGALADFAAVVVTFCRIDILKRSFDFTLLTGSKSVNTKG